MVRQGLAFPFVSMNRLSNHSSQRRTTQNIERETETKYHHPGVADLDKAMTTGHQTMVTDEKSLVSADSCTLCFEPLNELVIYKYRHISIFIYKYELA